VSVTGYPLPAIMPGLCTKLSFDMG
jgi:hypothetical protein